jgi:outer membrane protein TolC
MLYWQHYYIAMKKIGFLLLLFASKLSTAQDSTKKLSLQSFMQIVKTFHPLAKQAGLQVDKAKAELFSAKGSFDPIGETGGNDKTFDGVNYYRGNSTEITIPTWYGIEVSGGIEYLAGNRLDPHQTGGKTSFAGVSIPLAKNLLMDKRRAVLQQAKVMVNASEQEKRSMLNNLMMDATTAYWQWVQSYYVYKAYENVIAVNRRRFELIKQVYINGDRPAIDTTESLAQLQNFEYLKNDALLDLQNASVWLSNFLWQTNNVAYDLPSTINPTEKIEDLYDAVVFQELNTLVDVAKKNHPDLMQYNYKLNWLHIERKLKLQSLLPKLDLKYNQLGKGYNIASTATKTLFDNNYRFGLNFSMPLLLRQGRGDYKLAKLKITETKFLQSNKEIEIINKVKNYYNQLSNYKVQVNLLQRTYQNYLRLQRGEETRFFNGESSLFLVNARENKALETLIKLTETTIKYNKTAQGLQWAAGKLWQ